MCYGRCNWEDHMGDCTLNCEDKKFLLEKYGFEYPCPESDDDWEMLRNIENDIWDHREVREVMRALTKDLPEFITHEEASQLAIDQKNKFWADRKSKIFTNES